MPITERPWRARRSPKLAIANSSDRYAKATPTTIAPDPTRTHRPENREGTVHGFYGYLYCADKYEGLVLVGVGTTINGNPLDNFLHRALTFNPRLVIMDEPTAALAVREVQSVLDLIRRLKSEGIAVILISHRLNDVLAVTDRIVVLRHGRAEANLVTAKTNMNEVVARIVGGGDTSAAAAHEQRG